jgi:4a-hydroxytetrahydrobiopterin dehydratase
MVLSDKACVPCRGAVAPLAADEARRYLRETPGWILDEDAARIRRKWRFPDFAGAMAFARAVGALAEAQGHHPDLSVGWGYCEVVFQTHRIRGLHENDFVMAARVNALAEGTP